MTRPKSPLAQPLRRDCAQGNRGNTGADGYRGCRDHVGNARCAVAACGRPGRPDFVQGVVQGVVQGGATSISRSMRTTGRMITLARRVASVAARVVAAGFPENVMTAPIPPLDGCARRNRTGAANSSAD